MRFRAKQRLSSTTNGCRKSSARVRGNTRGRSSPRACRLGNACIKPHLIQANRTIRHRNSRPRRSKDVAVKMLKTALVQTHDRDGASTHLEGQSGRCRRRHVELRYCDPPAPEERSGAAMFSSIVVVPPRLFTTSAILSPAFNPRSSTILVTSLIDEVVNAVDGHTRSIWMPDGRH